MTRKLVAAALGVTQGAIGVVAVVSMLVLYLNLFDLQTELNISAALLPLYLLGLGVFGLFSVINGLYLISEGLG